jgi:hypothetical protein
LFYFVIELGSCNSFALAPWGGFSKLAIWLFEQFPTFLTGTVRGRGAFWAQSAAAAKIHRRILNTPSPLADFDNFQVYAESSDSSFRDYEPGNRTDEMRKICLLAAILVSFGICGCTKLGGRASSTRGELINRTVETTIDENGADAALIKAGLREVQVMRAADTSASAGTIVSFPPGSLTTDIEITIEEAAPIATAINAIQLGIEENLTSTGTAVAILAKSDTELIRPLTITLAMPPVPDLGLQDAPPNLVVFYKVILPGSSKIVLGILPITNPNLAKNSLSFQGLHFGAFQPAYTKTLLSEPKEIPATTPLLTKREVLELVPFTITGRRPFSVGAGDEVTVTGTGFSSGMKIVLGGSKVLELTVQSPKSATFVAPIKQFFGIVDLTANQDGIEQTVSLLYRGLKTEFPVITLTAPEVCSEYKYYDASGDLNTGTRGCSAIVALGLTNESAPDLRNPSTLPTCWFDGQTGCVTTERFKAVGSPMTSVLVPYMSEGQDLGVPGVGRKSCKNQSRQMVLDDSTLLVLMPADKAEATENDFRGAGGIPASAAVPSDDACKQVTWKAGGVDSGMSIGFCNDGADQCIYQDLLSGLFWGEAAATPLKWDDATAFCAGSLSGYRDWRLPTPRELIQAAFNGIKAVSSRNFILVAPGDRFWSATTNPEHLLEAWSVDLSGPAANSSAKSSAKSTTCVRP